MKKLFKWNYNELLIATFGLFLYCLSIKLFVVPNDLYNGGIMGLSQIIRTIILKVWTINIKLDIATIIYYLINIPLFIIAYKKMGKNFFFRTLYCVTISTIFLLLIPDNTIPLTNNLLTNILVGGSLCGFGCGLAFSVGASTGGTDIIGMLLTKKHRRITVGNFGLTFNVIVYSASALVGGIETMIYSVLYSVFDSVILDRMHDRNICSTNIIFSKENPKVIIDYIKNDLERDVTYWEAKGGYDDSMTYVTYAVLSKYEKNRLEHFIKENKLNTFVVSETMVGVLGNFEKKL